MGMLTKKYEKWLTGKKVTIRKETRKRYSTYKGVKPKSEVVYIVSVGGDAMGLEYSKAKAVKLQNRLKKQFRKKRKKK